MRNIIRLMDGTSMCPGEIVELRWSDIDFERKTIQVTKTRILNKDGATKTKAFNHFIEESIFNRSLETPGLKPVFCIMRKNRK